MARKKLLLIFNPMAGAQNFALNLYEVIDQLTKAGFDVTVRPTQRVGDAKTYILERGAEFDVLVASGGDGTINESISALMALPASRPILGVIPAGTTNDFSTSLGLPKDILDAVSVITDGVMRPLDIGQFEAAYFSYVAAFGLFTDVSYATPQSKKNVLGHLAYLLEGIKRLGSIHTYQCEIDLGEETLEGEFLFGMVTNSLSVGGFKLPSEHKICMDDGLFEIALLQMPTSFIDLQHIITSLVRQEAYSDSLTLRRAPQVVVRAENPLAWTLDGEFGGEHKQVTINNRHQAIKVFMPHDSPTTKANDPASQ